MAQVSTAVRVCGPLDVAALRSALASVAERHEGLRSWFEMRGTVLHQVVEDTIQLPFAELSRGDDTDPVAPLRAEMSAPFRPETAPMWRAMLLPLADEDHVFGLQVHHCVIDGEGMRLLQDELGEFYRAATTGERSRLGPASSWLAHLRERHRYTSTEEYQNELAYWQGVVNEIQAPARLPTSVPTDPGPRARGLSTPDRVLDEAVLTGLRALAGRHSATMTMVAIGCLAVALSKVTGAVAVGVGISYAGHRWAGAESTLGNSVCTMPVVFHSGTDVDESVIEAREQVAAALAVSAVSFEDLAVGDDVYWPDAYHVVVHVAEGQLPVSGLQFTGTHCTGFEVGQAESRYAPNVGVLVKDHEVRIWLGYDVAVYTAVDAEQLLDVFCAVLTETATGLEA